MADECLDQRRRMLAVAVDEHHRAEPGVIEAGKECRFLAEIARQGHHLDIEARGRQRARDRESAIAAAVVDIDYLAGERALSFQVMCDFRQLGMQALKAQGLIVEWHHDREPGARAGPGASLGRAYRRRISGLVRLVHRLDPCRVPCSNRFL